MADHRVDIHRHRCTDRAAEMTDSRADLIRAHFPEYVGGTCLCGKVIHNATDWSTHLDQVLTDHEETK